jgi:DnaJ-class molecular chaperone
VTPPETPRSGSTTPVVQTNVDVGGVIVTCRFCNGSGKVQDVSKWPPVAPCPGCKGAGVHRV